MRIEELASLIEKPEWAKLGISERGELTFACFDQAKKTGKNPKSLAEEATKYVHGDIINKVEATNGYVNIYLDFNKIFKLMQKNLGAPLNSSFSKKNVFLEHTSVNPNKALHIGHIRNSYIGEFLRRALKRAESNVITANFVEDTGTQVADIVVAFKLLKKPIDTNMKFDLYCSKVYKEVNEEYSKDEKLLELRRGVLQKIEGGDKETVDFLRETVLKILSGQMETLNKQGIEYDLLNMESYILSSGLIERALAILKEKHVVYSPKEGKNAGCIVIKYGDKERVLRRSDGTSLYVSKDIAYALWKHGILKEDVKWKEFMKNPDGSQIFLSEYDGKSKALGKYDMSITLVDSEQNDEQEAVSYAVKSLDNSVNYIHYSYEMVALSKETAEAMGLDVDSRFAKMSGRKGITIEVDPLLSRLTEKIIQTARENKKSLSEGDAFKLASNVLRYSLLKVSPSKMVIFDMEEALNIKGDTAVYINYAYARAKHILDNLKPQKKSDYKFDSDEEKILRRMMFWRETFKESIEKMKANILCDYLHGLCDSFNWFYEKNRVIGSERESERSAVVNMFVDVVAEVSSILGLFLVANV